MPPRRHKPKQRSSLTETENGRRPIPLVGLTIAGQMKGKGRTKGGEGREKESFFHGADVPGAGRVSGSSLAVAVRGDGLFTDFEGTRGCGHPPVSPVCAV